MKNALLVFLEKSSFWGKWAILGPKMACPYNFGSTLSIFLRFCRIKGVKRYMELVFMVFLKKF